MILHEGDTMHKARAYAEVAQAGFNRLLDHVPADHSDPAIQGCAHWLRSERGAAHVCCNILHLLGIKDIALISGNWILRDEHTQSVLTRYRGHIWLEMRLPTQHSWETAVLLDPWSPVTGPTDCIVSPSRESQCVTYKRLGYYGAELGIFRSPFVYFLGRLALAKYQPMSRLQQFVQKHGLQDLLLEDLKEDLADNFLPHYSEEGFEDPLEGIVPYFHRPDEANRTLN